jgi:hypothetical protein
VVSETSSVPAVPEGWYPVGDGSVEMYWNGSGWTNATRAARPAAVAPPAPVAVTLNKRVAGWIALIVGVAGGGLACLTDVSLLSGTGTVWVGVVIVVLALAISALARLGWVFVIVLALVTALSLASAIYDEVQLSHKRNDLSSVFGD